jgi:hypothetical protein
MLEMAHQAWLALCQLQSRLVNCKGSLEHGRGVSASHARCPSAPQIIVAPAWRCCGVLRQRCRRLHSSTLLVAQGCIDHGCCWPADVHSAVCCATLQQQSRNSVMRQRSASCFNATACAAQAHSCWGDHMRTSHSAVTVALSAAGYAGTAWRLTCESHQCLCRCVTVRQDRINRHSSSSVPMGPKDCSFICYRNMLLCQSVARASTARV